jgi:hypothetical protein
MRGCQRENEDEIATAAPRTRLRGGDRFAASVFRPPVPALTRDGVSTYNLSRLSVHVAVTVHSFTISSPDIAVVTTQSYTCKTIRIAHQTQVAVWSRGRGATDCRTKTDRAKDLAKFRRFDAGHSVVVRPSRHMKEMYLQTPPNRTSCAWTERIGTTQLSRSDCTMLTRLMTNHCVQVEGFLCQSMVVPVLVHDQVTVYNLRGCIQYRCYCLQLHNIIHRHCKGHKSIVHMQKDAFDVQFESRGLVAGPGGHRLSN